MFRCNAEYMNIENMNIANFINIYIDIYTYIICEENDSK